MTLEVYHAPAGVSLRAWAAGYPLEPSEIDALRRWSRKRATPGDLRVLASYSLVERRALLRADRKRRPRNGYRYRFVRVFRDSEHAGPWESSRHDATIGAIVDIDPMKTRVCSWYVERSDGRRQEISESVHSRGLEQYDQAIRHRDAVGVWG